MYPIFLFYFRFWKLTFRLGIIYSTLSFFNLKWYKIIWFHRKYRLKKKEYGLSLLWGQLYIGIGLPKKTTKSDIQNTPGLDDRFLV